MPSAGVLSNKSSLFQFVYCILFKGTWASDFDIHVKKSIQQTHYQIDHTLHKQIKYQDSSNTLSNA